MMADVAARLVWVQLPGTEIDAETARSLEEGVGGVVLFGANITGTEQLRRLTGELRRRAQGPLRIAIDHEGGHVARIGAPVTRFPSAMAIGATGSEELAYAVGLAAGRELAGLGIDVNLAPVLDVAADPGNPSVGARSFGSSPALVARIGAAMVRGYRDAGIAATAKHFPGHGRTPLDPHHDVATVAGGMDALRSIDLPPFRAAIGAGVDLVMATHVAYDGLTDGLPTTVSRFALTDLLRAELGLRPDRHRRDADARARRSHARPRGLHRGDRRGRRRGDADGGGQGGSCPAPSGGRLRPAAGDAGGRSHPSRRSAGRAARRRR